MTMVRSIFRLTPLTWIGAFGIGGAWIGLAVAYLAGVI